MKAVRPSRIFEGRTTYMASKLKDQRLELCTNDDPATAKPHGLASLVAAAGLGQATADQITDRAASGLPKPTITEPTTQGPGARLGREAWPTWQKSYK
jgi:hypothetical protein